MSVVGRNGSVLPVRRGGDRRPLRAVRPEERPARLLYAVPSARPAPSGAARSRPDERPGAVRLIPPPRAVRSGRAVPSGVSEPGGRAELRGRAEAAPRPQVARRTEVSVRAPVARRSGAARPVRRGEQYAPVRLTRRGKIVAQILLITTAVLAVVGIAAGTRAAADGPEPSGPRPSVVVHEGDTLWNIADRHAPNLDRRAVMDEIRRLNDLDGSTVEVGQKLVLPRQ